MTNYQISADILAMSLHKIAMVGSSNPPLLGGSTRGRQVSVLAESEGHHPDLHLTNYRNVQAEMPQWLKLVIFLVMKWMVKQWVSTCEYLT